MKKLPGMKIVLLLLAGIFSRHLAGGVELERQGLNLLHATTTNLDGSGIRVAQPEAALDSPASFLIWQINPANVGVAPGIFSYASALGATNVYPNKLGTNSWHAEDVAQNFYAPGGFATNVAHVDNLEANYFFTNYIDSSAMPPIGDAIVNQSFSFGPLASNIQAIVDSDYDDYAVTNKTLFVSAVDNAGNVHAPGTSYDCIGVGAYAGGVSSSIGPTIDNGRCKPDITAIDGATSFSTPQVAGAAAILMQAALRGDGGSDTNSAADMRTLKALLLNGAVKPPDWTNSNSSPLDARYGAGILNIFNSYKQLAGGKNNFNSSTVVATGGAHPPNGATGTTTNLSGWSFAANTNSVSTDTANHYYFNVSNSVSRASFALTATLVWNRQLNQSAINNLDLFLYNCANSNLVLLSTSRVDNVEHLYITNLAQGRYDLQVLKRGGSIVSAAEPYALAWEFFSENLSAQKIGTNVVLTFPIYPAGFTIESTTDLLSATWTTNNLPPPVLTNGQNYIFLNPTNPAQFFRLRR